MTEMKAAFTDEQAAIVKDAADARGMSIRAYLNYAALEVAKIPVVWRCYRIRAFRPGPVWFEITRTPDGMSDPRSFLAMLPPVQRQSAEEAIAFVKTNGPGDREKALEALRRAFEEAKAERLE